MPAMFDPNKPLNDPRMFNPNAPLQPQQSNPGQFDFEARNAAIEQRKRLLAALLRHQAESQTPNMPNGQMVGKGPGAQYVAPSWSENLNAALQPALARYAAADEGKKLAADQAAYSRADQEAGAAHVASRPQGRPGYGANEMDNEAVPPTQPSSQDMLAWAQKGQAIPSRRDVVARVMNDMEVNAPVRAENAQIRSQDREDRQTESRASLNANLQARREEAAQRSADARYGVDQRSEDLRYGEDQRSQDRRATIAARVDALTNPPEKPPKPLPAAQATSWVNNNSAIANIDSALARLAGSPDATGLKGYLPNVALSRMGTDDEKATRAAIANIGSLKIHDRSGAAVTISETPRLLPFIPTVNDDPKAAKVKLNGLKEEYQRMQQSIQDFAGDQYRMPTSSNPRAGVTGEWEAPAKVRNAADYAKVRSGATYTDPTGKVRTKP